MKKETKIEWYEYAQYFCYDAYLLICYLELPEHIKEDLSKEHNFNKVIGNTNFHLCPHNQDLIIPIIYNYQHSIELFCKGLIIFKGRIIKKENKIFYTHNLEKIYKLILDRYKKEIKGNNNLREKLDTLNKIIQNFQNKFGFITRYKYPEDRYGNLTLFYKNLRELSTIKSLQIIKNSLIETYKLFNETGYEIMLLDKNLKSKKYD